MAGLPPQIAALLDDEDVTDICLNGARSLFVDRGAGMQRAEEESAWSEAEFRQWVLDELTRAGKTWDARFPFVDATLPSGHRLHVSFPPVAAGGVLASIRRLGSARRRGPAHWRDTPGFACVRALVAEGASILISGGTGTGKTTLLNELLESVPAHERLIALEDTSELSPRHPHFVSLLSRPRNADGFGEITLRDLLRQTLRMRPDRIVLGECRGEEVLDLLQVLNTGHRGSMATLHANSARDAARRVELLCLLAGKGDIPVASIRELIACGISYLVHLSKGRSGREITEILRIAGREGDTLLFSPVPLEGPRLLCQKECHGLSP